MSNYQRSGGRAANQLRAVRMTRGYTVHAEGSVLVEFGATRVLCTASVEEKVPGHKRGSGEGWVTAEYGMLPRATHTRSDREAARGKQSGRTQEIQRLIGRSLRAVFDLKKLGERTIQLDCDVLQADGGTRTAAITGAYVAAHDAVSRLIAEGKLTQSPLLASVAAISVGIVDGTPLLDLEYTEDSACDTDMNVVMTGGRQGVFARRDECPAGPGRKRHCGTDVGPAALPGGLTCKRVSSLRPTTVANSTNCRVCWSRWAIG